jgi:hypothetical protein
VAPAAPRRPLQQIRVVVADGFPGARTGLEAVLANDTKKWEFASAKAAAEGSGQELNYRARLKKKVPADLLERRLRAVLPAAIVNVEIE